MDLQQYPQAIAQAATQVNELTNELFEAETERSTVEARIDWEVAFNPEMKNDLQRRVDRASRLLQDGEYQELNRRCVSLGQNRTTAIVAREQLEREFSVAKLMMRREIATLEAAHKNLE